MKIQLLQHYRGRLTRNQVILSGIYELDDERLFGVGQYLLDNGFAVLVEDVAPRKAPQPWTGEIPSIGDAPRQSAGGSDTLTADAVVTPPVVNYADMDMELLRAEVAKRDLSDRVIGTGANGSVKKVDLITALEAADAESDE